MWLQDWKSPISTNMLGGCGMDAKMESTVLSLSSTSGLSSQTSERKMTLSSGWWALKAATSLASGMRPPKRSKPWRAVRESALLSGGGRPRAETLKMPAGVSSPSATTMQFSVNSPPACSASVRSQGKRADKSSIKYLFSSGCVKKPRTYLG